MVSLLESAALGTKARFLKAVRELRGCYYVYYCPLDEEASFGPLSEFHATF